jgi:hypothetical protein
MGTIRASSVLAVTLLVCCILQASFLTGATWHDARFLTFVRESKFALVANAASFCGSGPPSHVWRRMLTKSCVRT